MVSTVAVGTRNNLLLERLPESDRESLERVGIHKSLSLYEDVWKPNKPIRTVVFPISGIVSSVTEMQDGSAVETAIVGRDGIVGVEVALGVEAPTRTKAFCQIQSDVLQIPVEEFADRVNRSPAIRKMVFAYTHALLGMTEQNVACNRLHTVEERLAKWLLVTRDRIGSTEIELTQEMLGLMLGVRRASVTVAARTLQEAGLIRYSRGKITILDQEDLEEASCECYMRIAGDYRRLLGEE